MRPSFWPTTHDILTPQMWDGGTAIFAIRAMLAALGAPTWGIYSGYEFVENEPRGTFQEPNDNEKYEYRPRRWEDADAIGISMHNGGHLTLAPRMVEAVAEAELDTPVIVGGIIPDVDRPTLTDAGVAAILSPGSSDTDVIVAVTEAVRAAGST